MFKTRITELFGIKYPIIAGGMQTLSRAELVAAVGEAGGIGFITASTFEDVEDLRKEIRKTRELTDKPFGVNINLFPSSRPTFTEEKAQVCAEEKVHAVETSGRSPAAIMPILKSAGIIVMHKCARSRDAASVQKAGIDAVTIVGYECGGHPSMDEIGTFVLLPRTRELVSLPLVAGGGIATAAGLVGALALGADGVMMGTRFMATTECIAHPAFKEWMIQATETDTAFIQKSINNPSRVIKNSVSTQVLTLESRGATLEELMPLISGMRGRNVFAEGDMEAGVAACGQAVGLIHEVKSVKGVIDEIMEGASLLVDKLAAIKG